MFRIGFAGMAVLVSLLSGCALFRSEPALITVDQVPEIRITSAVKANAEKFDRAVNQAFEQRCFTLVKKEPGRHEFDWNYRRYRISGRSVIRLEKDTVIITCLAFNDTKARRALEGYDRLMQKLARSTVSSLDK